MQAVNPYAGDHSPPVERRTLNALELALVFAIALTARLVYLHVAGAAGVLGGLFLDSKYYADLAASIRAGHGAGAHPYLLSPLYPYALALFTEASGGLDAGAVRIAQAIAGSLTAVLAAIVAGSIGGRRAAWAAGAVAGAYGPLIHIDAALLVSSLQALFITAGVAILLIDDRRDVSRRKRIVAWALAGVALGVAAALHPSGIAIAIAMIAGLWATRRLASGGTASARSCAERSLALAAGVALAIAPFTIRNVCVGGERVLLSANGGMNFWIGNSAEATGLFHTPPGYDFAHDPVGHAIAERAVGHPLTYVEASSWWTQRALADVRDAPARWLALLAKKLALFAHPLEIPQLGESFAWFRERAWPLRLPVDAREILILALAAPLLLASIDGRRAIARVSWPLLALLAQAALVALFFVTGRYRAPVMPLAIALAAASAVAMLEVLARSLWPRSGVERAPLAHPKLVVASFAFVALAFVASHFVYETPGAPLAITPSTGVEERHRGMGLYAQGRYAEAVAAYQAALEEGDDPITRTNLANALKALGRTDEAAAQYQRVLAMSPRDGVAWYDYGNLLRMQMHDLRGAEDAYRRAIDYQPLMPEAHFNLGVVLLALDEPEDAAAAIDSALSLAPQGASWRTDAENALLVARTRAAQRQASKADPARPK
jgi:tetratricopeptide (TPR) repeat protein